MTTKKEEQAREGGYYDTAGIGYDYDPDLAQSESGVMRVKQGRKLVTANEPMTTPPLGANAPKATGTDAKTGETKS
jgi:hypothetical protein